MGKSFSKVNKNTHSLNFYRLTISYLIKAACHLLHVSDIMLRIVMAENF